VNCTEKVAKPINTENTKMKGQARCQADMEEEEAKLARAGALAKVEINC
jgi:hypothetical protein